MCGIVGYMGEREACPILIKGLKRLEYRGYDSAGLVLNESKGFHLFKTKGKVADLENKIIHTYTTGTGIAHTRWATHGLPNDINAHPHLSESGKLAVIHNGIIENFLSIKSMLLQKGMSFQSETDTEVLINLIEYIKNQYNLFLEEAIRLSLNEIVGAYAIIVIEKGYSDKMIAARLGSPLTIGIGNGNGEFFLASDASPFIEYTKNALYLEDGEMGIITKGRGVDIRRITNNDRVVPNIKKLRINLEEIEKGDYEHFMLKEIYEQPYSIRNTMRGRLLVDKGIIWMDGIWNYKKRFVKAKRIIIIGCGTSWHAALIGEYLLEELAQVPVEVEYSSEFRYRNPIIYKNDIIIAVSQSGETADTLAAIKLAKEKGAFIFGICNVVESSIPRITDAGAYTHTGPEIGVASTKSFTAQVVILSLIALKIGKHKGVIDVSRYHALCNMLNLVPNKIGEVLKINQKIKLIARKYKKAKNFLYLGRGLNFPVALEGALKLKEISYIHAEGYPIAEMKHGPIALIDKNMPVVIIAPKRGYYEKTISNIQEIKARKASIIAIVNQEDEKIKDLADYTIEIPDIDEIFTPLITTIPLQLLAYHIAIMRGENIDQPRNLAKSVTVE